MELLLTDEQKMIRDSAATLLERTAGPKRARALRGEAHGFDRARWGEIAGAGWLSLLVPGDAGGLGLGHTELCLVAEEAGKKLLGDPLAPAAAAALALAEGEGAARAELLPGLLAGAAIVVPAFQEGPLGPDPAATTVKARRDKAGLKLRGAKGYIAGAAVADGFLVPARSPEGTVLAYVPKDAKGATLAVADTVDGCGVGTLTLANVAVPERHVVAGANRAPAVIARAADAAVLATGAELLGVMEQAFAIALDYIKTRVQFGRPIGAFQVLQHRAVNQYVEVEMMRSLLYQVTGAIDAGRGSAALAAAVKARASTAALEVTKSAIQLHGAIGFTDEHDVGLYLRRAMALASLWGTAAHSRARFAALAAEAVEE